MSHQTVISAIEETELLMREVRGRLLVCARTDDSPIASAELASWRAKIADLCEFHSDPTLLNTLLGLETAVTRLEQSPAESRGMAIISTLDHISELESIIAELAVPADSSILDISDFVENSINGMTPPRPEPESVEFFYEEVGEDDPEFDAELLEIFSAEAEELLANMDQSLAALAADPDNRDALWEIRRNAHTFKGSAGIVGMEAPSRLAHRIEDLLDRFAEADARAGSSVLTLLRESTDCLRNITANSGNATPPSDLIRLHAAFDGALNDLNGNGVPAQHAPELPLAPEILVPPAAVDDAAHPPVPVLSKPERKGTIVRVPLTKLDELSGALHDLLVAGSAIDRKLKDLKQQISELTISSRRVQTASSKLDSSFEAEMLGSRSSAVIGMPPEHDGLDSLEFDRYTEFHQTSRQLAEAASDTSSINSALEDIRLGVESLFDKQARSVRQLKDSLVRIRLVEFGSMKTRLQRTARVTAEEEKKQVDVVMLNEGTEVDTQMLDSLTEPLLHLIRNAVVHGIEPAETRRLLGKPETGRITISLENEVSHALLTITDDGSGISTSRLRERAADMAVSPNSFAGNIAQNDPLQLIFVPGLTTADGLSLRAGRGVGMSIVKESVESFGGTISVETRAHVGTTFRIRLPLRMAVVESVVVRVEEQTLAIPANKIQRISYASSLKLSVSDGRLEIQTEEGSVPVTDLRQCLGGASGFSFVDDPVVIEMSSSVGRAALIVNEITRTEELALKSMGYPLDKIKGVLGAAITGNDEVLPLLDVESLFAAGSMPQFTRPSQPERRSPSRASILVVDDSPSVRHTTTKIVENAGWASITARDGVEALDLLKEMEQLPVTILSDIEMPRMDGFEMIRLLKNDERLREIPVIVITSRSGEKHRGMADELGIASFLSKPFNERELIGLVREFTAGK